MSYLLLLIMCAAGIGICGYVAAVRVDDHRMVLGALRGARRGYTVTASRVFRRAAWYCMGRDGTTHRAAIPCLAFVPAWRYWRFGSRSPWCWLGVRVLVNHDWLLSTDVRRGTELWRLPGLPVHMPFLQSIVGGCNVETRQILVESGIRRPSGAWRARLDRHGIGWVLTGSGRGVIETLDARQSGDLAGGTLMGRSRSVVIGRLLVR